MCYFLQKLIDFWVIMDCILWTIELSITFCIFLYRKSNCYIFFAGYSFVTGVSSWENKIYKLNNGSIAILASTGGNVTTIQNVEKEQKHRLSFSWMCSNMPEQCYDFFDVSSSRYISVKEQSNVAVNAESNKETT